MRKLVCGILLMGLSATHAFAVLAEQIVAVVNGQLLFHTDILRNQTFFEEGPDVENLVNYKLLLLEAKQFVLSPPQEDAVDLSLKALQKKFQDAHAFENALKETGFTLEDLRREILDRLWVKQLLQDRITFFIFITDEEVGQYYQQRQSDFAQKTLEEVEESIRAILEKEKEETRIKEYLARIKSQANIEISGAGRSNVR